MSNGVGSPVGSGAAGGPALRVLGWAAYLACSWTWCIGMFLPVLLVRDYGPWGFVVFAVPNVIGAAAMGWVLRRPGHSEALTTAHAPMAVTFTAVTVAFQTFFLVWGGGENGFIQPINPGADASWTTGLAARGPVLLMFVLGLVALRARDPRQFASIATWVLSIVIAAFVVSRPGFREGWTSLEGRRSAHGPIGAAWLAPVCILGFLLCPYLDLTFHRARQSLPPREASRAFILGFGVLFFAMILFTLGYAGISNAITGRGPAEWVGPVAAAWLATHIAVQLVFTVLAHTAEWQRVRPAGPAQEQVEPGLARWLTAIVVLAAFIGAAFAVRRWGPEIQGTYFGLTSGEIGYRVFMSFYGLVFPAYVWLCMIPTWRAPAAPGGRQLAVWLGACLAAAPLYWMGFIERREWWLAPGLAVVLLARLLIPRGERGLAGPSGAPVPAPRHPPPLAAGVSAGPDHQGG